MPTFAHLVFFLALLLAVLGIYKALCVIFPVPIPDEDWQ